MTAQDLEQLTDKIWKSVTQDRYDADDIGRLISIALGQRQTLDRLAQDNQRLTEAIEIAGKHIEQLEPLSHLVQYAEEASN